MQQPEELRSQAVAKELSSVSHGHGHGHGHKTAAHKAATSPGQSREESTTWIKKLLKLLLLLKKN